MQIESDILWSSIHSHWTAEVIFFFVGPSLVRTEMKSKLFLMTMTRLKSSPTTRSLICIIKSSATALNMIPSYAIVAVSLDESERPLMRGRSIRSNHCLGSIWYSLCHMKSLALHTIINSFITGSHIYSSTVQVYWINKTLLLVLTALHLSGTWSLSLHLSLWHITRQVNPSPVPPT